MMLTSTNTPGYLFLLCGLLLVIAHAWLVINQRFVANVDYSDGMIYYIPAIISVALLPLALTAIKKSEKY